MRIGKKPESPKPLTADEIAELADNGEGVSRFFTGEGKMIPPMPRSNEDERNGQKS
jgi:hypothetical protein